MTARQENRNAMYLSVSEILFKYLTLISTIQEMLGSYNTLKDLIELISGKSTEKITVTKGKAQDKYDARDTLITKTLKVAGAIYAYGRKSKNNELIETGNITKSSILKLRDGLVEPFVNGLLMKARDNSAILISSYGLKDDDISSLETSIGLYSRAFSKRESSVGERKGAGSILETYFDDADDVILELDGFAEVLSEDNPQFFAEYKSARVIKDLTGGGERKTEQKTQAPVLVNS